MGIFSKRLSQEEFIAKSREVHGDRYDYSLVEYTGGKNKVSIICAIHGSFHQQAASHIRGIGCPKCGIVRIKEKISLSQEEFIAKSREVHGDRYDYSLVEYTNLRSIIIITCPIHGSFNQRAGSHIKGVGCSLCCGNKKHTNNTFIAKSREVHGDRYDYSLVEYKGNKNKVMIICTDHGVFEQSPNAHISQRQGCPKCWYRVTDIEYLKEKLTIEEKPIENDGKIQCRCTYCGDYFTPTPSQLRYRINSLGGKISGENRLYCSDKCKDLCPVYRVSRHYKNHLGTRPDTSRPDQPELRRLVLERDNFICQRCGSSEDLHCHHITGVEINPVESADIDNCITLCYTCHSKTHSEKGCSMQKEVCK